MRSAEERLKKVRIGQRDTIFLVVLLAALLISLCGMDLSARSQVASSRPQAGLSRQVLSAAPPGDEASKGRIEEAGTRRLFRQAAVTDRLPLGRWIMHQATEKSGLLVILLGAVLLVGSGLVARAFRTQDQEIRRLEATLNTVEAGLMAKVVLIEERLRRESDHGTLRERI